MSKNKKISKRHRDLIALLAAGTDIETTLAKLRISPGRAAQMLTSSRHLDHMDHIMCIAYHQRDLAAIASTASALAALRGSLQESVKQETRVKAATVLLAQRRTRNGGDA